MLPGRRGVDERMSNKEFSVAIWERIIQNIIEMIVAVAQEFAW